MRARLLLVFGVLAVCVALGLVVAGIPGKAKDRPLSVRLKTAAAPTTTSAPVTTTVAPTTTTSAAPVPRPPASVQVRAANATSLSLAATHMTTRITSLGYQTLPPLNSKRTDLESTEVVYSPGFETEARALAGALGATQVLATDPDLVCAPEACSGDLVVFVGRDLAM